MPCTSPRKVGFKSDGKTISWSPKTISKQYATFQLPCGKCIECRLQYAREWSIRCVHEAQMHSKNSFITLTYSDENITERLDYTHFQKFMKRLRKAYPNEEISFFVTGEYGEKNKRAHWHALIFNWEPTDGNYKYSNERGDKVYSSETLDKLWGLGITEYGSVTLESANYCARYAAKKLIHGQDQDHDYNPISKKSQKNAIGKKWLEQFYKDILAGYILHDGKKLPIPRYYIKWLQKNKPSDWEEYVTNTRTKKTELAERMAQSETQEYIKSIRQRGITGSLVRTRNQIRAKLSKKKFKQLQENLKL